MIKYRLVILPDRDIQPEEWEALLEALDEVLHGALDREAWQWSQAFYLPSCPARNAADALFVHNRGVPLQVDEFVRRGRAIIAARSVQTPTVELAGNLTKVSPPSETLENIERVRSMLSAIDPDIRRKEWRQTCWVVMATGWACAKTLIREWSEAGRTFTEKGFVGVVKSFRAGKGTGFGTLIFMSRNSAGRTRAQRRTHTRLPSTKA